MSFLGKVAFGVFAVVASPFALIAVAVDEITGDKKSSEESKPNTKLLDEKYRRTKVRKEALTQLLSKHRNRIKSQLTNIIEEESFCLGEVAIDMSNDTTYKVRFTDLDKAVFTLNMANDIILEQSIAGDNNNSSEQITLKSNSSLIDEIVQKANSDYGSLAGIDSYDDYVESQDPFLDALKRV